MCKMVLKSRRKAFTLFSMKENLFVQEHKFHKLTDIILSYKEHENPLDLFLPKILLHDDFVSNINASEKIIIYYKNKPICDMKVKSIEKLSISDIYEFLLLFIGTTDRKHPTANRLYNLYTKGYVYSIEAELNFDDYSFEITDLYDDEEDKEIAKKYYISPKEMIDYINTSLKKIAAFQTRNPIHRAHEHILRTLAEISDEVYIHTIAGELKSDDIPLKVRIKAYEELIKHYFNENKVKIAILPINMYYAGAKEALYHLKIRDNFGFSYMAIGRDHAGIGKFYSPYVAHDFVKRNLKYLKFIKPVFFKESFYCKKCQTTTNVDLCPHDETYHIKISGTELRNMLKKNIDIPNEFSRPEVLNVLKEYYQNN